MTTQQEIFPPSNKLWVSNLSTTVTVQDLQNTFGRFGEVTRVYLDPRCFAFVDFDAVEPAKKARRSLHRQPLHGHQMVVQFAKPIKGSEQHQSGSSHSNVPRPPHQHPHQYSSNPAVPHQAAGPVQYRPPHAVAGTSSSSAVFRLPNITVTNIEPAGPSVRPVTTQNQLQTVPAWMGVIAKGGVPICQASCSQLLPRINAEIPVVLNLSEKTTLDSLQSYFRSGTIRYSTAIFMPETAANVGPYAELAAYLAQKGAAGIAKLTDGSTSLYLVPSPSSFLSDELMLSGSKIGCLYGVVIEFPPPPPPSETSSSGGAAVFCPRPPTTTRSGPRVARDPRRRPENIIRWRKNPPPSSDVGVQMMASMMMPSSSSAGPSVEDDHRRDDDVAGEQMTVAVTVEQQPGNGVLGRPMESDEEEDEEEMYDPEDPTPLVT